ncbi:hypothetical protein E3N88_34880 [Mikania micrantha]|uniref:Integrase catalytic domain-containing protein n=1 Tax=Mikania micrantha TaxID=192012 RepID=A0A5N6LZE5_9ASTR|nr:hypothetical protein E3N88_34880 [Mikania micrantha]
MQVENIHTCLMIHEGSSSILNSHWFIDSGCSNHMTGVKESFTQLDESFKLEVNLGDKKKLKIEGKGTVRISLSNFSYKLLDDVYYVPMLEYNLLSVGQLMKKGYSLLFDDDMCVIRNKKKPVDVISIQVAANNMFLFDATKDLKSQVESAPVNVVDDTTKLWHLRYGHFYLEGLKRISQNKMVRGLPNINQIVTCESCILGKQHQLSYNSSSWRATKKLELIHADLCGPMQVKSLGGSLYYFLLIDDLTRMCWVYFLKQKSQAFEKFKLFKAMVENEVECSIKVLRTYRGGEFCSSDFNSFCENNGIKRELNVPYTPQHNGVVERKNRTIMGMTRSMLKEKCLPNYLWAEGVATAIYLINRSSTKAIKNCTPIEAWTGHKPSVHHLKIFGCIVYGHIPVHQRQKLDDRSEKCIFIGYAEESRGYRLYNPSTKKIQIERNVTFLERDSWKWDDKSYTSASTLIEDPFPMQTQEEITVQNNDSSPPNLHSAHSDLNSQNTPLSYSSHIHLNSNQNNSNATASSSSSNDASSSSSHNTPPQPSRRISKPPTWMKDYHTGEEMEEETQLFALSVSDLTTYQEAVMKKEWYEAMVSELKAIEKHDTWKLVDCPSERNIVGLKWLFKTKLGVDGKILRYKARLVGKGYSQQHGIDYQETFAHVARFETIRVVIAVAAQRGWPLYQLGMKTAFLNGELTEEIYVQQAEGFVKKGHEGKVYLLKKALYGLKQVPRAWYS